MYDNLGLNNLLYRDTNLQEAQSIKSESEIKAINEVASEDIISGSITGGLDMVNGFIKGGQTKYNTGTGFFLGLEDEEYKFSIGSDTAYFKWDGENISLTGDIIGGSLGGAIKVIDTDEDIQDAIDGLNAKGGGTLILKNGTYTLTDDITVPSNINIEGQNSESCILDFDSNAAGIVIEGTNTYSTGVASVNNWGTAVTGSGTTWVSEMVGRSMWLDGIWYPIAAVTDTTHLTIGLNYAGSIESNQSYMIATQKKDIFIGNLIIKGSATAGITCKYTEEVEIDDVNIQTSTKGLFGYLNTNFVFSNTDCVACVDSIVLYLSYFTTLFSNGSVDATNVGIIMIYCKYCSVDNSFILNSLDTGIEFTACSQIKLSGIVSKESGGKGFDLLSFNTNITLTGCSADNNTSDGIKLTATSDKCTIIGCPVNGNGGYGINIANANCDENIVRSNQYDNNTSGAFNDEGTDTNKGTTEEESSIIGISASDTLQSSADTERTMDDEDEIYELYKEIQINRKGILRVKFDIKTNNVTYSSFGRIYINGVAEGTERINATTSYVNYSEDIDVEIGDLVQLYCHIAVGTPGGVSGNNRNFRIYYTRELLDEITVNTD